MLLLFLFLILLVLLLFYHYCTPFLQLLISFTGITSTFIITIFIIIVTTSLNGRNCGKHGKLKPGMLGHLSGRSKCQANIPTWQKALAQRLVQL